MSPRRYRQSTVVPKQSCNTRRLVCRPSRKFTCGLGAPIERGRLPPALKLERANTLVRGTCPLTRGAILAADGVASSEHARKGPDHQLVVRVIGLRGGGSLSEGGVCKVRIFHLFASVATRLVISRRVHRHKVALRKRQAARERRGLERFCPWWRSRSRIDAE